MKWGQSCDYHQQSAGGKTLSGKRGDPSGRDVRRSEGQLPVAGDTRLAFKDIAAAPPSRPISGF